MYCFGKGFDCFDLSVWFEKSSVTVFCQNIDNSIQLKKSVLCHIFDTGLQSPPLFCLNVRFSLCGLTCFDYSSFSPLRYFPGCLSKGKYPWSDIMEMSIHYVRYWKDSNSLWCILAFSAGTWNMVVMNVKECNAYSLSIHIYLGLYVWKNLFGLYLSDLKVFNKFAFFAVCTDDNGTIFRNLDSSFQKLSGH